MLLLLLPFQAGWALAASYCEHRGVEHEQHFGHHDGHHHDGATNEDASSTSSKAADDGDATHCHGLGLGMVLAVAPIPRPLAATATCHLVRTDWQTPIPAPPERPQWARHA